MLTVAQISDVHICRGHEPARRDRAEARLRQVLRAIMALRPRPVAIVASGDLTESGDLASYVAFRAILAEETDLPVYPGVGNHDLRANFIQAFGWSADRLAEGFVQYCIDLPQGLRLVMCDSLDEGEPGGGFCETRARWLRGVLDDGTAAPALVAIHHPPVISGIRWMDPSPDAPWIGRLAGALQGQGQVQGLICGHLHRPFVSRLAGVTVAVAAATDIQLTLDLTPIDMRRPDGRELLVDEPPGYALHLWEDGRLTTHFCVAGPYPTAVIYTRPF